MKTPFQHFIQLAQRVLDATDGTESQSYPFIGVSYLSDTTVVFGAYPVYCRVQLMPLDGFVTQTDVTFNCPIDYDCNGYDQLFIEWTKNVDEFLASDSMLLLDNQIKAGLRK